MKIVEVKCKICNREAIVKKTRSGVSCFRDGGYCGVMRVVRDYES